MASISGGMGPVTVTGGSNDSNGQAQGLANIISSALASGKAFQVPTASTNPSVGAGLFVATTSAPGGTTLGLAETLLIVNDGVTGNFLGSGGQGQSILIGNAAVGYNTGGGTGTLVSGDAPELIAVPTVGGASFSFTTGSGNDTFVLGSGLNTVNAGSGVNTIFTSGSTDVINSAGIDLISGVGSPKTTRIDTINGGGAGTQVYIAEAAKNFVFNGGAGTAFIFYSTGSDTVNLGSGGGIVGGGSAGNNMLTTGLTGAATLFGGGNGDVLTAQGSANNILAAGPGNETLTGAGSTGNNIFFTSTGSAVVTDGKGNDVVFTGAGATTINGGSGQDLFAIVNGRAGGTVLINNFTSQDKVTLQGYAAGELATDLAKAAGSSTVTLSDGTAITFKGIIPNSTNFV